MKQPSWFLPFLPNFSSFFQIFPLFPPCLQFPPLLLNFWQIFRCQGGTLPHLDRLVATPLCDMPLYTVKLRQIDIKLMFVCMEGGCGDVN